jgi:hypothetical protein
LKFYFAGPIRYFGTALSGRRHFADVPLTPVFTFNQDESSIVLNNGVTVVAMTEMHFQIS